MGYSVKWVEEHLGITRKALHNFEKIGLMPQNENNQYRDYTDEDIEKLWAIRVLQGIGYSLKEILSMSNDDFDLDNSLHNKILELKEEKVERNLNYARTIKLTGQLPSIPTEMGKMSCNDFQKYSHEKWNVFDMPNANSIQEITDTILHDSNMNIDLKHISSVVELINTAGTDYLLAEHVLPKEIVKKMDYGIYHPDIQLMMTLIYENSKKFYPNISAKQFSRDYVASQVQITQSI